MSQDSRLTLDYGNMMAPRLGGRGLDPDRLDALAERFSQVHEDTQGRRDAGELGFYDLPRRTGLIDEIEAFADGPGQAFENVVVLGIGGSALGTTALLHALRGAGTSARLKGGTTIRACSRWTTWTRTPRPRSSTASTSGARSSTW